MKGEREWLDWIWKKREGRNVLLLYEEANRLICSWEAIFIVCMRRKSLSITRENKLRKCRGDDQVVIMRERKGSNWPIIVADWTSARIQVEKRMMMERVSFLQRRDEGGKGIFMEGRGIRSHNEQVHCFLIQSVDGKYKRKNRWSVIRGRGTVDIVWMEGRKEGRGGG